MINSLFFLLLKDQAQNVLKLDRTPIEGRPLFISPNEDKTLDFGQSKFKYPVNMEKKKLFVSGLPFSTTKENLEEIFKAVISFYYKYSFLFLHFL
jgi:RNA recognition motif-containing protein